MIARKLGTLITSLLILGITTTAWGFNKDVHREVSEKAVKLYKQLYPQNTILTSELAQRFIDGSVDEDAVLTLGFQRLFNWHFYDPYKSLGRAWWGAYRSNTHRFDYLSEKFFELKSDDIQERYELAGRLAHHFQDMSSPPHTVPVYHTTKDQFDKLVPGEVTGITFSSAQLDTVLQQKGTLTVVGLNKLLKDAADRTIASVNAPVMDNGKIVENDWTDFWRNYEMVGDECGGTPKSDFGCYGKMTYWNEKGVFSKSVFEQYHKQRITNAVEDSLHTLILLSDKSI